MSLLRSRLQSFLIAVAVGLLLTAASLLAQWECCMDGSGRGVPFAIIHPSHQDSRFFVLLDPSAKLGDEIDIDNILGNWLAWSMLAALGRAGWRRWVPKRKH